MSTTTLDDLASTMVDSLREARRLYDDDQQIKGQLAFGEALAWFYETSGRKRMPPWLVGELDDVGVTAAEARKMLADYRRGVAESQMAEAMKPEPGTELEPVVEGEVVGPFDESSARSLDERIRTLAGRIHDDMSELEQLVATAKAGNIHESLGWPSWTAYLADALRGQWRVGDREERRELVEFLSGQGLSNRATAAITGVSEGTVRNDLSSGAQNYAPADNGTDEYVDALDGSRQPRKKKPKAAIEASPDEAVAEQDDDDLTVRPSEAEAQVSQSADPAEWYTPREYIEAAVRVMGGIDLDPASNAAANSVVGAATYYTAADDGLQQPWRGRIWLNPPYGQPACGKFCEKLTDEYAAGNVTAACVLVNNATETKWFQMVAAVASAICFPLGRVRFWHPDRESLSPLQGQAVFYLGDDIAAFRREFEQFGFVIGGAFARLEAAE